MINIILHEYVINYNQININTIMRRLLSLLVFYYLYYNDNIINITLS